MNKLKRSMSKKIKLLKFYQKEKIYKNLPKYKNLQFQLLKLRIFLKIA